MSMQMTDDFTQCMATNTRRAARAVTRRYDHGLRPFGVTAAQFALLGSLLTHEDRPVSELADYHVMERTSLTRNLDVLERKGLISCRHADSGNGRLSRLTTKGRELIDILRPRWRQAQQAMRDEISDEEFSIALKVLQRLAAI
jgi:DNA-binding MarR family transcriptional regulator